MRYLKIFHRTSGLVFNLIFKVAFLSVILFFLSNTNGYPSEGPNNDNCSVVSADYAEQISNLIEAGEYGRIYHITKMWEESCGLIEPVFRVKALLKIHHNSFPGELDSQNMLNQAIAFEIRDDLIESPQRGKEYFELHPGFFGYIQPGHKFDHHTEQWARRLLLTAARDSISRLFLQLYEGQTEVFFSALKDGHLQGTNLALDYQSKVAENRRLPEFNMGVNSGLWVPKGNLQIIGPKPTVGINLGVKTTNMFIDAVFEVRFGKTNRYVLINLRDTLVSTRNYQGGYLGVELTRILTRGKNGGFEIFAGLGYDIIEIIEDQQIAPEGVIFGSPVVHLGLGYRFHFRNRSWLSIKPGYYFIDHQNPSGSPLSGNAISVRFTFGLSENARKSDNLKRLGVTRWW